MRRFFFLVFTACALLSSVRADDSNYSIAVGEKDQERLTILNEIYNPYTFEFLNECPIEKGAKVLEIGCGLGILSQALAERVGPNGYVLGTDISEKQIAIAKTLTQRENLEFRVHSAYDLESLDQQFDLVYGRFLLTHLPNPALVVAQVKKVLKPGGKFIIEDISGYHTMQSSPHVPGITYIHTILQLLSELEGGSYTCFSTLPDIFSSENLNILHHKTSHPPYDTPRRRTMLTHLVSSLKEPLQAAGTMTQNDYLRIFPLVQQMENDSSLEIQGFEFEQYCVQKP